MEWNLKCSKCGEERSIYRQEKTDKMASFWCENCNKTVKPSEAKLR